MSNRGDTREQPSNTDPACPPPPAGWGYLTLAATAGAGYAVAYALDQTAPVDLGVGAYGAAMMVFIAGVGGYVARTSEARVRRAQAADTARIIRDLTELTGQVRELVRQVQRPASGGMYASGAARGGRSFGAVRVIDGDTQTLPAPADVRTSADETNGARAQGYAEGYIDGLARRGDDDPAAPS
ncbi:hypothetical protein ACIBBG_31900 [Micromonospora chersina]|uniref:hypothetical protein n=1 Tax=Micromonospora chersina TaxID=47854 RepID=UPI0037B81706